MKDLVKPLCDIWKEMQQGSRQHNLIAKVLTTQVAMQEILHDHKYEAFLPMTSAVKFNQLVNSFLKDYSLLANMADREKKLLFSVTPKFHWLWHLGDRSQYLNPRKGNTMMDGDFVGQSKDIVAACASG